MYLISIHAAREGGDATAEAVAQRGKISIHAAREGGDGSTKVTFSFRQISIHAAREGGDVLSFSFRGGSVIFQSTPPVKAATRHRRNHG